MHNRAYFYEELSPKAKAKAIEVFQAWYDDVVFDNEKKSNWKTVRFATRWFKDYGWFFYEDGTRA